MSTATRGHDQLGLGEFFACFMPATGEICGTGRTREAAFAAAKASEHPSLQGISHEIEYEVWPCSADLYAKVQVEGGDIAYDHWDRMLVTEQEAARLAADATSSSQTPAMNASDS